MYIRKNFVNIPFQKRSMKSTKDKSPDFDLITEIACKLPVKNVLLITYIFNSTLRLSYFPLLWKFSTIIMIPKLSKPLKSP